MAHPTRGHAPPRDPSDFKHLKATPRKPDLAGSRKRQERACGLPFLPRFDARAHFLSSSSACEDERHHRQVSRWISTFRPWGPAGVRCNQRVRRWRVRRPRRERHPNRMAAWHPVPQLPRSESRPFRGRRGLVPSGCRGSLPSQPVRASRGICRRQNPPRLDDSAAAPRYRSGIAECLPRFRQRRSDLSSPQRMSTKNRWGPLFTDHSKARGRNVGPTLPESLGQENGVENIGRFWVTSPVITIARWDTSSEKDDSKQIHARGKIRVRQRKQGRFIASGLAIGEVDRDVGVIHRANANRCFLRELVHGHRNGQRIFWFDLRSGKGRSVAQLCSGGALRPAPST